MFKGIITALITPLTQDHNIDEKALQDFIEWQIQKGIKYFVILGTTGESSTLNHKERNRILKITIEVSQKRAFIIAGTGTNTTQETILLTRNAQYIGADAVLIVTPYYNQPTQRGLFNHYKSVHDATNIPMIVYSNPSRAVIDIKLQTIKKLSKLPRIVGIKDSSQNLTRPLFTRALTYSDFCQLCGEDSTYLPFLVQGGDGCISILSNIVPKLCLDLHQAWSTGDILKAQALNTRLIPLYQAILSETNPGPIKYAAKIMGLCHSYMRLPMVEISEKSKYIVKKALKDCNIVQ